MLFHLGALWRLNELGYLPKIDMISSVSGGSIIAGVLAYHWKKLETDINPVSPHFENEIVKPIRLLAGKTIDVSSILKGVLTRSIGKRLVGRYRKYLFGKATLATFPDKPLFVINATNLQSGALWRFTKSYMWDYRVGKIDSQKKTVEIAQAVAASSAFPPFLSPLILKFDQDDYTPGSGRDLQSPPYTTRVVLTDGGVYDNLGLERAWKNYKTVLVSNGGGKMQPIPKPSRLWLPQTYRVLNVIDNQVRNLRVRHLIGSYKAAPPLHREGTYWGIWSNIDHYKLPDSLPCPHPKTSKLANISTRLKKLDAKTQEQLINWGYAICDTALRKHHQPPLQTPPKFPYPIAGV